MRRDSSTHPKHYHGKVEPIDLILTQGLNFCEGNVVKLVCRSRKSGELLADLHKAQWYLNTLVCNTEEAAK